jgi:hypothetical protein
MCKVVNVNIDACFYLPKYDYSLQFPRVGWEGPYSVRPLKNGARSLGLTVLFPKASHHNLSTRSNYSCVLHFPHMISGEGWCLFIVLYILTSVVRFRA